MEDVEIIDADEAKKAIEKIVDDMYEIEGKLGDRLESLEVEVSVDIWYEILKRMYACHYSKEMIKPSKIMGKNLSINQNMDHPFAFKIRLKDQAKR